MVFCVSASGVLRAGDAPQSFKWEPLRIVESVFTRDLGMLDSEREEYATNLVGCAVGQINAAHASPASLVDARRMIALAMHLSPRNKKALVANFQLSKGVLPEVVKSDYSPQVFARLLLTRSQLLEKQGGDENRRLARMFAQLAAGLDPKNEDAIYASETQRLDHGEIDWQSITEVAAKKP